MRTRKCIQSLLAYHSNNAKALLNLTTRRVAMGKYTLDMERYKALARQVAAEGCVLLKNDNNT